MKSRGDYRLPLKKGKRDNAMNTWDCQGCGYAKETTHNRIDIIIPICPFCGKDMRFIGRV
jgi:rubrerythrin